jgi:hypothetical protein
MPTSDLDEGELMIPFICLSCGGFDIDNPECVSCAGAAGEDAAA